MNTNETELLLSRIVDGEASSIEWNRLKELARTNSDLWRDIAEAQREHLVIVRYVDQSMRTADRVEAPVGNRRHERDPHGAGVGDAFDIGTRRATTGFASRASWSGWSVAALIAIAAAFQWFVPATPQAPNNSMGTIGNSGPDQHQAGVNVLPVRSSQQALRDYIDLGRESGDVIAELPTKVLVETRPSPTGEGYELLYLRQILERTHVPSLYEFEGQSEAGQATLTRLAEPTGRSM
jgi:hypothetical protein